MSDTSDTTQATDNVLAQGKSAHGHQMRMTLAKDGISPILASRRPTWPTYSLEVNALADEYIELYRQLKPLKDLRSEDERFTKGFIYSTQNRVAKINANLSRDERWPTYGKREIEPFVLSKILIDRHYVARIRTGASMSDDDLPLGIYVDERIVPPGDPRLGTYSLKPELIARAARIYSPEIGRAKLDTLLNDLRGDTPIREMTVDPNISPFNNGIFDSKTGELRPYTPDDVVINKFAVNYVPNAPMPTIVQDDGTTWSPDMLLSSFTSDEEVAMYLFEILGLALRPFQAFDGMIWLYSTVGCNGKGTYCELLKNLLGPNACATLNVRQLEQDFRVATIPNRYAIIADENPVGTYLSDSANLKTLSSQEPLTLNPKYDKPFQYTFHGIIVQCLNELPRTRDRTPSFLRRLNIIPFERSFLGSENKAIKHHHLKQKEVLEWFASVAMTLDLSDLKKPAACERMSQQFLTANSPVQEFWNEASPDFAWDLVPHGLAYEMYKSWMAQNNPNGTVLGRNTFITEWMQCANDSGEWLSEKDRRYSSAGRMEGPERCMAQWEAPSWLNPNARITNTDGRCTLSDDMRKPQYQGILRKNPRNANPLAQANAHELVDHSHDYVTPDRFREMLRARGVDDDAAMPPAATGADATDDENEKDEK